MTRHLDPQAELAPLSPEDEEELFLALRAVAAPEELDPRVNERLIEAALDDPLAPPTAQELVESARLRDALDGGPPDEDAQLARALAAAATATLVPEPRNAALVERALESALPAEPKTGSVVEGERGRSLEGDRIRPNVIYVAFGAAVAVAAVAAAALLVVAPVHPRNPKPAAAFAASRTTTDLFPERFETAGTTERVDRIMASRQHDLRKNRYLEWGVQ